MNLKINLNKLTIQGTRAFIDGVLTGLELKHGKDTPLSLILAYEASK